jgi:DNA-directed RNA polymerase subunit beta
MIKKHQVTQYLNELLTESLCDIFWGNGKTGEIIIPANRKITKELIRSVVRVRKQIEMDPSPAQKKIQTIIDAAEHKYEELERW